MPQKKRRKITDYVSYPLVYFFFFVLMAYQPLGLFNAKAIVEGY